MGFLANLVKVFPSLAMRPLHITGESYAGVYIVRRVPSFILLVSRQMLTALYNEGLFRTQESAGQNS